MPRRSFAFLGLALAAAPAALAQSAAPQAPHPTFLEQYCSECHNAIDWAGGVAFDTLEPGNLAKDAQVWEKAVRKLRGRLMPPPGEKQPEEAVLDAYVGALERQLDAAAAKAGPRPGHVVLHRLNRTEYAYEIDRLLALEVDPASLLPPDAVSDGFNNVAEVLNVSPTFIDEYIAAARQISLRAVGEPAPRESSDVFVVPEHVNQTVHVAGLPLGSRGGIAVDYNFPADGEYEINVTVASIGASPLRSYPTGWLEYEHTLVLAIDEMPVWEGQLGGPADLESVDRRQTEAVTGIEKRFHGIRLNVKAGPRRVTAAFVSRSLAESDAEMQPLMPGQVMDSVPIVGGLEVVGPRRAAGVGETPSRKRIFICRPANAAEEPACAGKILTALARAAFRRPVDHADMQTVLGFYRAGAASGGFETGIQKALMAILASPKFLYRAELPPQEATPGSIHEINALELAARLSFFLWSRGPDEELLRLAESGRLLDAKVLEQQVRRMLASPKARTLVTNFAFQWLKVGGIDIIDPDPRRFPNFDEDLRSAFRTELAMFLESVLLEDRSVLDLLRAKHTFVNERLARHYGLQFVRGQRFRQVEIEDPRRWGLLGKGGVLLLTSYPDRTSPVLRGEWILKTLMGAPPAAPPPGVETNLAAGGPGVKEDTVRVRLEKHRTQRSCNQCHGVIDPLGLALENFNAIGEWSDRDRFAGVAIDPSGEMAGGRPLTGPNDLREALLLHPERFAQTLTENLMTYALGRSIDYYDMPEVRAIVRKAAAQDYRFAAIVMAIVQSDPFRKKSGS
jgi:hypothetical protein